MLIDSSKLEPANDLVTDICIVGGGAAGLILAHELAQAGIETLVLESGGLRSTRDASRLVTARAVTRPGFELSGVRRRLGGSLGDWGANCSLLEPNDFAGPAESGSPRWPAPLACLNDYSARAGLYLTGFEGFPHRDLIETSRLRPVDVSTGLLGSDNTSQLSEKLYLRGSKTSANQLICKLERTNQRIRIVVNSTVLKLDISAGRVRGLTFAGRRGIQISLRAQFFILASGTENAPLLMRSLGTTTLEARSKLPALGRWLHAHLLSLHGFVIPGRRREFLHRYMLPVTRDGIGESPQAWFAGLHVSGSQERDRPRLATAMFFEPVLHGGKLLSRSSIARARTWRAIPPWKHRALAPLAGTLLAGIARPTIYAVRHFMEQPPRWNAEVSLGPPAGPLGLPRPEFSWHVGELEQSSMQANCSELGPLLAAMDAGQLVEGERTGDTMSADFGRNVHPMGGTVMGSGINDSVVDQDLKVHGIANLYICGGSVVPRSGTAMVTGVIAQLAMRLGDHLKQMVRN